MEKKYSDEHFNSSIVFIRISFIFGILMYSAFALVDIRLAPEIFPFLLKIRFFLICPIILITTLISFFKWFKKIWQTIIVISIFFAGGGIISMLFSGSTLIAQDYYVGLILVLLYGYFLIKLRYIYATISGTLLVIIYFIVDYHFLNIPKEVSFANGFFLVSANLSLMIGSYFIEYYTRGDFYSRHLLDLERSNVETVNKDLEIEVKRRTAEIDKMNQKLIKKINELKHSQHELKENEEQLRMAFDASNATVWGIDLTNLKLIMNDLFLNILDFPLEQLTGIYEFDLIHQEDRNKFKLEVDKLLLRQTDMLDIEFRLQAYDNSWKWLHAWGKVSEFNSDGVPLSVLGTIYDITTRKENELELNKYRLNLENSVQERTDSLASSQEALMFLMDDMNNASDKLIQVNKQLESVNKELESFSYSVSHDLRAPLRGIKGFTKIMLEDYQNVLDKEGQEYLLLIKNNVDMMNQLISDLLEFSRLGKKVIIPVMIDFKEMISRIFTASTLDVPDREIKLEIDDIPTLMADLGLLNIVFTNLISNAVKFTSQREIAIIKVGYKSEDKSHLIYVKDNGVGFDMNYADKLYGVFQRMHASEDFDGYGVGLSIVKRIVVKHGGSTWAESEPDKGATFYISLPKNEDEINQGMTNDSTD
ncbi:MAG: ATP-binding protein [Candidatus Stygibacter australis]|nr:ATP-binding protein [Candidatus Stygibacter australis]